MDPASTQVFGEFGPRPVEPGLDGPDRPGDGQTDLLVGEVLLVEEREDQPVFGPEPGERPLEFSRQVVGIGQPGAPVFPFLDRLDEGGAAGTPREGGPATIGGDAEQPGLERTIALEAREASQGT